MLFILEAVFFQRYPPSVMAYGQYPACAQGWVSVYKVDAYLSFLKILAL